MNFNNKENSLNKGGLGVNQGCETASSRGFHRFYIGNVTLVNGNSLVLPENIAHQVLKVLRMKVGDTLIITNGLGFECLSVIDSVIQTGKNSVSVTVKNKEVIDYTGVSQRENRQIIACVPIIRKERFEWMIEKLSELHVRHIVPIITKRTLVKNISVPRLNKIIIEAMEQSGGVFLPTLHDSVNLPDLALHLSEIRQKEGGEKGSLDLDLVTFDFNGRPILEFLQSNSNNHKAEVKLIAFCIGPEGGFTDEEKVALNSSCETLGIKQSVLSFGRPECSENLVLRTETAAISAAVSMLL